MGLSFEFYVLYYLACLLLGLTYAFFLYRKEIFTNSKILLLILFSLRTIFIASLAALLFNPIIKSSHKIIEKPILILAKDFSESIIDSSLLTNISKEMSDFKVYEFSFSDKVLEGLKKDNDGLLTDYSIFFEDISSRFENQHIAAMVFESDGVYNSGSNPLYMKLGGFPIFPIAQGDTSVNMDVSISQVKHNNFAFLGNTFPLEISVITEKCIGKDIEISIFNNGKKVFAKKININLDNSFQKINVNLTADQIGLQYYKIKVSNLLDEKNINNNAYTAYIDVIDSQYKILFLGEGIHPDLASYRSVVDKNKNYSFDNFNIDDFDGNIEDYQLIILFGIKSQSNLLNLIKSSNLPVLAFNLKPEILTKLTSLLSLEQITGQQEVQAIKSSGFTNFTFSQELLNLIDNAPPLYVPFCKYNLKVGLISILSQQVKGLSTNNPIIFIDQNNDRKMAFITAEGFWKWKLYDYSISQNNIAFDELFAKLTQYLVLSDDKSRFRLDYKRQITENTNIFFNSTVYNKSYELINDKIVEIIIYNEKGDDFIYEFSKLGDKYILDAGILDVGKYTFIANVKGTEMLSSGSFDIISTQLEKLNTIANHKLLYQIAELSEGELFYPNQMDDIINAIRVSKLNYNRITIKEKLKGIINIPLILLILLTTISMEWFLRKYNGLT